MKELEIGDLLHEGKAKKVFHTNHKAVVAVQFKDDATAFNAQKKAQLAGKGLLNWEISARLFEALETRGVASHYLGCLEPGWMAVQALKIVPLEVVLRNLAAGSLCKQLPITPGSSLQPALLDLYYKDDALGDPLLTEARLELLALLEPAERVQLEAISRDVNRVLQFGRCDAGKLLLADEISPDTCRLWNQSDQRVLDKDRFRKDLGGVVEAYGEVLKRVQGLGPTPRQYR